MARSKLYALVRTLTLTASVGAPSLAAAADLLPPPPPPPPPPPVEIGGGWYLRGDIGASVYGNGKSGLNTKAVNYGDCHPCDGGSWGPSETHYGNAIGGGGFAGVGVGYQITPWLRGDVTGEYRYSTGLRGNTYKDYGNDIYGLANFANEKSSGSFDSAVALANLYFDVGTWYGVTLSVGGGVGGAWNRASGYTTNSNTSLPDMGYMYTKVYVPDDCNCEEGGGGHYKKVAYPYPVYDVNGNPVYKSYNQSYTFKSKTTANFAWALHAALAYNVTEAFKVELAYRYLHLGTVKTGVGIETCPTCTGTIAAVKVRDIDAHDIKLGFRYALGGFGAAPLPALAPDYGPAPGPIVRKY